MFIENTIKIKPIFNDKENPDLVLSIQQIEFNVPVTLDGQPVLLDIETHYHGTGGGFWGAFSGEELIETIAMIATGHHACAVRKMFVKKEYRDKEKGTAQLLLEALIAHGREHGITNIYLGTVHMLKAVHRFYEKNGFQQKTSEQMPSYFPGMMGENVYYHLNLQ